MGKVGGKGRRRKRRGGEVGIAVEILGQHLAECHISYSLNWEGWAGMSVGQEQCGTFTWETHQEGTRCRNLSPGQYSASNISAYSQRAHGDKENPSQLALENTRSIKSEEGQVVEEPRWSSQSPPSPQAVEVGVV